MMKHRIAWSVSAIHLSKSVSETIWHRSETRRTWSRVSHVGIERNEDRCSMNYVAPSPATQTPRTAGSRCSWLAPKTVSRAGGPPSASQGLTCLTVPAAETALCTRKVSLRPCQPGLKAAPPRRRAAGSQRMSRVPCSLYQGGIYLYECQGVHLRRVA